jgi:hypothetical protein
MGNDFLCCVTDHFPLVCATGGHLLSVSIADAKPIALFGGVQTFACRPLHLDKGLGVK